MFLSSCRYHGIADTSLMSWSQLQVRRVTLRVLLGRQRKLLQAGMCPPLCRPLWGRPGRGFVHWRCTTAAA